MGMRKYRANVVCGEFDCALFMMTNKFFDRVQMISSFGKINQNLHPIFLPRMSFSRLYIQICHIYREIYL